MDDFKEMTNSMTKNIKKLQELTDKSLNKIMEYDPEKVSEILKDNNELKKAFERKDLNAIMKIQQKYANKSHE